MRPCVRLPQRRPVTLGQFADIRGVGEAKLARYGEEFVAVVRGHSAECSPLAESRSELEPRPLDSRGRLPNDSRMAMWVGTSGYNYPEWRGTFYPEKLAAAKMLPYYAERFNTVEINYTFYRTPNAKILAGWSEATPEPFKLTLKAPKRITHTARLKDCDELLQYFVKTAQHPRRQARRHFFPAAALLQEGCRPARRLSRLCCRAGHAPRSSFATRPGWTTRFTAFSSPKGLRSAWLKARSCRRPVEITADYAYFRLRDEGYTPQDLVRWAQTVQAQDRACKDVFVYFKHEESGTGPAFARIFLDALGAAARVSG